MDKFIKSIGHDLREFFSKYFVIINLLSGIILLIIGILLDNENLSEKIIKLIYTIGSILLTSGVFAGVVKSNQFTEIYKIIIRDIIYCTEHLEKRNDLEKIWENVTKVLSNKKFSNISEEMNKNIKKYFLPLEHDYYYDNFQIEIIIDFSEQEEDYIIVKEITKFNIVCEDEKLKIKNKFSSYLKVDMSNKEKTKFNLVKLRIDNNEIDTKTILKQWYDKNYLWAEYEKELQGKKSYTVYREHEREINLKYNNIKSQIAVWIYNNLTVDITYPKALDIDIRGLGLISEIENIDKSNKFVNRKYIEYKGLVYKNQGIFMLMKRNKLE